MATKDRYSDGGTSMAVSKALVQLPTKPHALYRFFDRSDVLLYVGITANMSTRLGRHRKLKPWWVDVRNITVDYYDTREAALQAEAEAIKAEKPLYNTTHNELVQSPDDVPQVVTWTPHGPRQGRITGEWIETNWRKVPAALRDLVEIPAYDQGRRELAEEIFYWFDGNEVAELKRRGRRDAEEEGDEFPNGVAADDAYIAGRAAVAAFSDEYENAHRLEVAAEHLIGKLPPEVRDAILQRARSDVEFNQGDDYTALDVTCWAIYCLGYAIEEGTAIVALGEQVQPEGGPWVPAEPQAN